MTYPEFLVALSETPRDWKFMDKAIRRFSQGYECPITSLRCTPAGYWNRAAVELGLDFHDARAIVMAADGEYIVVNSSLVPLPEPIAQVRQDLLVACGLTKVSPEPEPVKVEENELVAV